MTITKFNRDFYPVLNRIFENDFDWNGGSMQQEKSKKPAVNIRESNDGFILEMAAPGMKKEDFKINYEKGILSISAEGENFENMPGVDYRLKEFDLSGFTRKFKVDEKLVETETIHAKYENGILNVSVPKREEVKSKPARKIEIL